MFSNPESSGLRGFLVRGDTTLKLRVLSTVVVIILGLPDDGAANAKDCTASLHLLYVDGWPREMEIGL